MPASPHIIEKWGVAVVFISRRNITFTYKILFSLFGITAIILSTIGANLPNRPAGTSYQNSTYPLFRYIDDYQSGPRVSAKAAILVDRTTGTILYAKSEHHRRAPASTTKIVTALVTLERVGLEKKVKVSPRAARVGGSSIYLRAGEVFTVEELLEGALLKSGNDATVALAEAVSGEMEEFVALMNQRAETLGAANSSFANPHGLTAPNHYSSAFDLALFANFALGIPTFREFVAKREGKIGQEGGEWVRKLKNTNRLLWAFPGADGVKTGTTNRAGPCLVSSATRDGRQLICVVLMSYNRWRDASLLLEYGFNNFKLHQVAKKGEVVARSQVEEGKRDQVELVASDDLELVVRTEEANLVKTSIRADKLSAPVARHQEAGTISAELDQVELGRVSLLTRTSVPRQSLWEQLKKSFGK